MAKKVLALVLAILFALALFSGCGPKNTPPANTAAPADGGQSTPAPAAKPTQAPTGGNTPAPTAEPEPEPEPEPEVDHLAPGHYAKTADGKPAEKYEYPLPLTERDVRLRFFTITWTSQYMPDGLMENVDYWIEMQKMTGVHLEFLQMTAANCKEQFAVLAAADDIPDITSQGQYRYSGTSEQAIDEQIFANLYNYTDYMPNYLWEIYDRAKDNINLLDTAFVKKDKIVSFYGLNYNRNGSASGWSLRQDLMDKYGLGKAEDVDTIAKAHDVLYAFKTQHDQPGFWPMNLYSTLEREAGKLFTGLNTYLTINLSIGLRLIDGVPELIGISNDEKEGIEILRQWFSEGLINPNYTGYTSNTDMTTELSNGEIGFLSLATGDASNYNVVCEGCNWQACHRLLREPNQTVHYGLSTSGVTYGSFCIGAKSEEIPLATTWCDWQYSESGSEYITWGVPGVLWERNDKGERVVTDFALNFDRGYGWAIMTFANCVLSEAGLNGAGDKPVNYDTSYNDHAVAVWTNVKNDNAWVWRTGAKLNQEETDEVSSLTSDVQTYQAEMWSMMIDGSAGMDRWDEYVKQMKSMGFDRMLEIYTDAYNRFMAEQ